MNHFEEILETIGAIKEINGGNLASTPNEEFARSISGDLLHCYGKLEKLSEIEGIALGAIDFRSTFDIKKIIDFALKMVEVFEMRIALAHGAYEVEVREETHLVELSKAQVEDIEHHIKCARGKIRETDAFEENHKRRLLLRLEKLQSEINKKISDLDVMLAGVTEVTAVAGQSAQNLNPVVDLFKKIFQIADSGSEEPLALPSPPKQITDRSEEA